MYLFIAWSNLHASPEFLLNVMESPEIIHAAAFRHAPAVCKLTATGEAHAPEYSGMPKEGHGNRRSRHDRRIRFQKAYDRPDQDRY
jgi:hypothetical protein